MKHAPDTSRIVLLVSEPPNACNGRFLNSMCLSLTNCPGEIQALWGEYEKASYISHATGTVHQTDINQ
jgi:hypothetical protein